jgi:hypothetical protein
MPKEINHPIVKNSPNLTPPADSRQISAWLPERRYIEQLFLLLKLILRLQNRVTRLGEFSPD